MRSDEHPEQLLLETDRYSRATERLKSGASLSGHERNHVFLNQNGDDYVEVSGVSGLDHPGDSRAFAVLDYDRDGWQDIAVVNANAPMFQLYRNQMGERGDPGEVVAVRFEGWKPELSREQTMEQPRRVRSPCPPGDPRP